MDKHKVCFNLFLLAAALFGVFACVFLLYLGVVRDGEYAVAIPVVLPLILHCVLVKDISMKIFEAAQKAIAHRYANERLADKARHQTWVSQDGRETTVEDMEPTHAKHIVAKLIRELHAGKCAYLGADGQVKYAPLMKNLVDGEQAFGDEDGHLRITDTGGTAT